MGGVAVHRLGGGGAVRGRRPPPSARRGLLRPRRVFALGTTMWSTSQALWQHPAAVLFLCVALLFLSLAAQDPAWAGRAGLPLALVVAARHADVALVAVLAVAAAARWPRQVPRMAAWAAPVVVALAAYQWFYFGSPSRARLLRERVAVLRGVGPRASRAARVSGQGAARLHARDPGRAGRDRDRVPERRALVGGVAARGRRRALGAGRPLERMARRRELGPADDDGRAAAAGRVPARRVQPAAERDRRPGRALHRGAGPGRVRVRLPLGAALLAGRGRARHRRAVGRGAEPDPVLRAAAGGDPRAARGGGRSGLGARAPGGAVRRQRVADHARLGPAARGRRGGHPRGRVPRPRRAHRGRAGAAARALGRGPLPRARTARGGGRSSCGSRGAARASSTSARRPSAPSRASRRTRSRARSCCGIRTTTRPRAGGTSPSPSGGAGERRSWTGSRSSSRPSRSDPCARSTGSSHLRKSHCSRVALPVETPQGRKPRRRSDGKSSCRGTGGSRSAPLADKRRERRADSPPSRVPRACAAARNSAPNPGAGARTTDRPRQAPRRQSGESGSGSTRRDLPQNLIPWDPTPPDVSQVAIQLVRPAVDFTELAWVSGKMVPRPMVPIACPTARAAPGCDGHLDQSESAPMANLVPSGVTRPSSATS